MPSQASVVQIEDAKPKKKKRFDIRDFNHIAEMVVETYEGRKQRRKDKERVWKEIDRQLQMDPDTTFKNMVAPDGSATSRPDPKLTWLPENELPLQAQTLEVISADVKRMLFPRTGQWFDAKVMLSDSYIEQTQGFFDDLDGEIVRTGNPSIRIAGDETDHPSRITQDNVNKVVVGRMNHLHRQYAFRNNVMTSVVEALKYGVGVGQGRVVNASTFVHAAQGTFKETDTLPVFVPKSIKNTYLDDSLTAVMGEGFMIGPSTIYDSTKNFEDLVLTANKGSNNPDSPDGGWMPAELKGVTADLNGNVQLLEYEGDLVVARKTVSSLYIPGAIVTVLVQQGKGERRHRVVRFRFRKMPYSSYMPFSYFQDDIKSFYGQSPLMMGRVMHASAVLKANIFDAIAQLQAEPPISWDKDDQSFAATGGPVIEPRAKWATTGGIEVHSDIGDLPAMAEAFNNSIGFYYDVTGVNRPRLGAQTVSHTTAFAKNVEDQRGQSRTVDFVSDTLDGPLSTWLAMEYALDRKTMKGRQAVYIDAYDAWVEMTVKALPENVRFQAFGAGGPIEEQVKTEQKLQALNNALQVDLMRVQLKQQPQMNLDEIQKQMLLEGGWTDIDTFFGGQEAPVRTPDGPTLDTGA